MKEKKGVCERVVLKYHQDIASEFFRSDLPVTLKTRPGSPTPAPGTRPQQIMKCRYTDCRTALSVHREANHRGLSVLGTHGTWCTCSIRGKGTESVWPRPRPENRPPPTRAFVKDKYWLFFALCCVCFDSPRSRNGNIVSVWKPRLSRTSQTPHPDGSC